jgi:hypothetical protein
LARPQWPGATRSERRIRAFRPGVATNLRPVLLFAAAAAGRMPTTRSLPERWFLSVQMLSPLHMLRRMKRRWSRCVHMASTLPCALTNLVSSVFGYPTMVGGRIIFVYAQEMQAFRLAQTSAQQCGPMKLVSVSICTVTKEGKATATCIFRQLVMGRIYRGTRLAEPSAHVWIIAQVSRWRGV